MSKRQSSRYIHTSQMRRMGSPRTDETHKTARAFDRKLGSARTRYQKIFTNETQRGVR